MIIIVNMMVEDVQFHLVGVNNTNKDLDDLIIDLGGYMVIVVMMI